MEHGCSIVILSGVFDPGEISPSLVCSEDYTLEWVVFGQIHKTMFHLQNNSLFYLLSSHFSWIRKSKNLTEIAAFFYSNPQPRHSGATITWKSKWERGSTDSRGSMQVRGSQWRIYIAKWWTCNPNPYRSNFLHSHAVCGESLPKNRLATPNSPPPSPTPILGLASPGKSWIRHWIHYGFET